MAKTGLQIFTRGKESPSLRARSLGPRETRGKAIVRDDADMMAATFLNLFLRPLS